jgi:hypothetical protein
MISPGRVLVRAAATGFIVTLISLADVAEGAKKKAGTEGLDIECTGKKSKKLTGPLFSISPTARTITIQNGSAKRTFRVASNCAISTAEKSSAGLVDLKLGTEIQVTYFVNKFKTEVACSISPAKASK